VSSHDVLHTFPNPLAFTGKTPVVASPQATAADIMTCDPLTTTPETPIEEVARLMCDRKVSALPVLRGDVLAGLITESDIFRAFAGLFDPDTRGVRITFDNSAGQDAFPLIAEVANRHRLRVMSFVSMHKHERPMCVVQVTGNRRTSKPCSTTSGNHAIRYM
jgi:acetoin utilization protein AcuB